VGKVNKKILVIDDDADDRSLMKMRLETHHYDVVLAENGAEGLIKAESEKPDLIIVDVMMPEMDGYTFVREIKTIESLKEIPIIVLTSRTGMKDLFEVEGVRDYVTKPYEPEELIQKIQKYLP
jgi:CheY-like chemotaxis protein